MSEPAVNPPKAWLSWSSGKDSACSLAALRQRPDLEVVGLVTTLNQDADRVAMHGVRRELLEQQAESLGLPLHAVDLPWPCSNEQYEQIMSGLVRSAVAEGISQMAFGDLFLEDIRDYRERQLQGTGLAPIFPLWGRETADLAREMIGSGIQAVISCVDTAQLDARFAGRSFDRQLLEDLPATADPCGERGEFHTFVWDGPGFDQPIPIRVGDTVERDGFLFADLLSGSVTGSAPVIPG